MLEGGAVADRRLCPSTLDVRVLVVGLDPTAALVGSGAVCVRLPLVPHRVLVRTSVHDAQALAAYRNSWAVRPCLRPTHSGAIADVSVSSDQLSEWL